MKLLEHLWDHVAGLRILGGRGRMLRRLHRLMSAASHPFDTQIWTLCQRMRWTYRTVVANDARVMLVQAPGGLLSQVRFMEGSRAFKQGLSHGFHACPSTLRGLCLMHGDNGILDWEKSLSQPEFCAVLEAVHWGCTVFISSAVSMHAYMEAFDQLQDDLRDAPGWSGEPHPVAHVVPAGPDGTGSCIIAVRYNDVIALIATSLAEMPNWIRPGEAFPRMDVVGFYQVKTPWS